MQMCTTCTHVHAQGIVLAQSQSRRARIEDPKLAPVPPIEVAQCNSMLHCNEDSPRLSCLLISTHFAEPLASGPSFAIA
eukprot:1139052-Pelagomonas_calceolata.AAC.2